MYLLNALMYNADMFNIGVFEVVAILFVTWLVLDVKEELVSVILVK